MKKTFLSAAFAATLALTGCDKENNDRPYYWSLEVRNETSKHIDLTYWDGGQPTKNTVKIGAGQTGTITGILHYGPDGNVVKLTDPLKWSDEVPFGYGKGKSVGIQFNNYAQPGGIFNHDNWGFRGDFYEYTYTLTVNNEFLEKLSSGYPKRAGLTE